MEVNKIKQRIEWLERHVKNNTNHIEFIKNVDIPEALKESQEAYIEEVKFCAYLNGERAQMKNEIEFLQSLIDGILNITD